MRQKKQRDEGGGASWMDTYGDLVTLLLCFFVMLFASSTMNEEKWIAIIESFRGQPTGSVIEAIDVNAPTQGFAESDLITQTDPNQAESENEDLMEQIQQNIDESKSEEQQEIEAQFNELYEQLQEYVGEEGLEETVLLEKDGLYIYLTIVEGILFDSGDANIRDEIGEKALTDISVMINQHLDSIRLIMVEGHTDNVPIQNANYTDNLDLSVMRANNVVRWMRDHGGIEMSMFRSRGAGEFEPIASNDTPEGKQKNRRVNIILLAKNVDEVMEGMREFEESRMLGEAQTGVVLSTQSNRIVEDESDMQDIIIE